MNLKPELKVRCACFDHAAGNVPRKGRMAGSADVRHLTEELARDMVSAMGGVLFAHFHNWCPTGRALLGAMTLGIYLAAINEGVDKRGTLAKPITEDQWPEIFEHIRAHYDEAMRRMESPGV